MKTVFWKELADHLNSTRFVIILCLILSVALLICNAVGQNINQALGSGAKFRFLFLKLFTVSGSFFSLTQFIAFFGPLLGIVMGFDAINKERKAGTLSKLLCQPIHRDDIINGKFLAGLATLAITFVSLVLLITGLGLTAIGVVPTGEELLRLLIYLFFCIVYVGLWLAVAIFFSVLFRSTGTSALASLALWLSVAFFIGFAADMAAMALAPAAGYHDPRALLKRSEVIEWVNRLSPVKLYSDVASFVLNPGRKSTRRIVLLGPMESMSMRRFDNPLPLSQSLLVVMPYLTSLLAMAAVCFAASYMVFMRQEIRAV